MIVHGSHDPLLVALSLLLAAATSYTALDLAGRTRSTGGWARRWWLLAAAVALGLGIWSMHFVAMLALGVPGIEVVYAPALTTISVLIAVVATGIGFFVVRTYGSAPVPLVLSGLFMGTGIAAMHYTGMAAMRMPAIIIYDPQWVTVSIAIAVGASIVALWLAFGRHRTRRKLVGAIVMGLAISGMHYSAMTGASFSTHVLPGTSVPASSFGHGTLALGVAGTTFVILLFALVAAQFDRRMADYAAREAAFHRRSEEAFRALYRRTPLPLVALGADARIVEASDAWLSLLGYERAAVVGRPLADFLVGEAGEPCLDPATLAHGNGLRDIPCRLATRGGETLDALISAESERDEDGRLARVLCGVVDVTAHRRAEEALRQSQKMEAIGQITGGVAHDFNNLLSVILGNLNRLRPRVAADPDAAACVGNALAAAERGAALTQRMLAFARRQNLEPTPLDPGSVLDGMKGLLRQSLGPEIRIETHLATNLPRLQADANQLELALLNLAVNARDAMPDGGTLTLSASVAAVAPGEAGDLVAGTYVVLTVQDTGSGMDAATLARAREPFFTTKPIGKGTGLGLSMVHGFAQQSGGLLRLASAPGDGVRAEMWLPATDAASAPLAAPTLEPPVRADGPLTVLAVDDEPLVLMNTVLMLEELGHRVLEASSGAAALSALADTGAEAKVDLVITDQGMPGMTGLQLADAIRQRHPDLPVLLATGYADLPAGDGFVRLGKPFDHRALASAIARAMRLPDETGAALAS